MLRIAYWRWQPPFGTQYSGGKGLDRTQYAKGQYAARKIHVISYSGLKTFTTIVQFSRRNMTKVAYE